MRKREIPGKDGKIREFKEGSLVSVPDLLHLPPRPRRHGVRIGPQPALDCSGLFFVLYPSPAFRALAILPIDPGHPRGNHLLVDVGSIGGKHNAESSPVSIFAQILNFYGLSSHKTLNVLLGAVPESLPFLRAVNPIQADFDLPASFSKHGDGVAVGNMDDLSGEGVGCGGAEECAEQGEEKKWISHRLEAIPILAERKYDGNDL